MHIVRGVEPLSGDTPAALSSPTGLGRVNTRDNGGARVVAPGKESAGPWRKVTRGVRQFGAVGARRWLHRMRPCAGYYAS